MDSTTLISTWGSEARLGILQYNQVGCWAGRFVRKSRYDSIARKATLIWGEMWLNERRKSRSEYLTCDVPIDGQFLRRFVKKFLVPFWTIVLKRLAMPFFVVMLPTRRRTTTRYLLPNNYHMVSYRTVDVLARRTEKQVLQSSATANLAIHRRRPRLAHRASRAASDPHHYSHTRFDKRSFCYSRRTKHPTNQTKAIMNCLKNSKHSLLRKSQEMANNDYPEGK